MKAHIDVEVFFDGTLSNEINVVVEFPGDLDSPEMARISDTFVRDLGDNLFYWAKKWVHEEGASVSFGINNIE